MSETRAAFKSGVSAVIYTNTGKLIKGNTVRDKFLVMADSVPFLSDVNTNDGYLGIDAAGRVDVSFINAVSPSGKFLRDDGSWQPVTSGSAALNNQKIGVGDSSDLLASSDLNYDGSAVTGGWGVKVGEIDTGITGLQGSGDTGIYSGSADAAIVLTDLGAVNIDGTVNVNNQIYVGGTDYGLVSRDPHRVVVRKADGIGFLQSMIGSTGSGGFGIEGYGSARIFQSFNYSAGNYGGTSIPIALSLCVANIPYAPESGEYNVTISANKALYHLIGSSGATGAEYGSRLDATGLRIGQASTLHNINDHAFEVQGDVLLQNEGTTIGMQSETIIVSSAETLGPFAGIQYDADYSANFANYSLVDLQTLEKKYGLPVVAVVTIFGDSTDAARAGGISANAFGGTGAAQNGYDWANTIQASLGGSATVLLQFGNCSAAQVGGISLTADFNSNVALRGVDSKTSEIGAVSLTNAGGNGYSFGSGQTAVVYINGLSITSVTTTATGTSGSGGAFWVNGNDFNIGTVNTSVTNAGNSTGGSGAIQLSGLQSAATVVRNMANNVYIGTINANIPSGSSATSGSVSIIGSNIYVKALDFQNGNNASFESRGYFGTVNIGVSTISIFSSGACYFENTGFFGGQTISTPANQTFTSCYTTSGLTLASSGGASNISCCQFDSLTSSSVILAQNSVLNAIIGCGSNSVFTDCTIGVSSSTSNPAISGLNADIKLINCSILGGSYSFDNTTTVTVTCIDCYIENPTGSLVVVDTGKTITTSAATLKLLPFVRHYIYTGAATATWELYPVDSVIGTEHNFINRGPGSVTINSAAGGADIFDIASGTSVATISLPPFSVLKAVGDGVQINMIQ